MRTLIGALAAISIVTVAHAQAPSATSTGYRYVDDAGVIHWAQSFHLVPEKYAARATTPSFGDQSVFPAVPPYVRPATHYGLAMTVQHQPRLQSVHGWWASEAARIVAAEWKGRGQHGEQPTLGFYILRDGSISIPEIERSSGDLAYDLRAKDALIRLRRLPPLPPDFPGL